MIRALIRKDSLLLRHYLRSAAATTLASYACVGPLGLITAGYMDPNQSSHSVPMATRAFIVLSGGSNFGFVATAFFAAMLAGSAFTLERSDRSAEFLACLPPTRGQNLLSKLCVVLGALGAMILLHLLANAIAHQLAPYVRTDNGLNITSNLLDALAVLTFIAVTVAMCGGAAFVSAPLKSNGAPVLCGLLTPLAVLGIVSLVGWALDVPAEGKSFAMRFTSSSLVLGLALGYAGCHWYLVRNEP